MNATSWIREGIAQRRAAIYMKVMAVFFCLGALSHLASIMGLVGEPWANKPWYFRTADLLLLLVPPVVAWGLWRTRFWGVVGWLAVVVLLQAVPMLLLIQFAAPDPRLRETWYVMLATHAVLLGVFFALLRHKKAGADLRDRGRPEGPVT